jgi:hypothetical protein
MRVKIKHDKSNKMAGITAYLSTTTLSVAMLNSPIKNQRLVDWIKKKNKTNHLFSTRSVSS